MATPAAPLGYWHQWTKAQRELILSDHTENQDSVAPASETEDEESEEQAPLLDDVADVVAHAALALADGGHAAALRAPARDLAAALALGLALTAQRLPLLALLSGPHVLSRASARGRCGESSQHDASGQQTSGSNTSIRRSSRSADDVLASRRRPDSFPSSVKEIFQVTPSKEVTAACVL